jgi:uncharacterized protein DUF222/HNH endonuclease
MEVAALDPWDEYMSPSDDYQRERCALDARMLEWLGHHDAEWPDDPEIPDLASELAARHRISAHSANERLRIARALRDLPHIRKAHAGGMLTWDQLRWVTKFATPETDRDWSVRAQEMSPWRLREEAERQHRIRRREAEDAQRSRRLSMCWDDDHRNLDVFVELPAEQGTVFEGAVRAAAENVEADPEAEDPRAARLADALMALVTSSGGGRQRPTLVVHADAEVVAGATDGSRHLAETSTGVQLHGQAVRRMACMARVRVAIERQGRLVGLVSASRGPTDAQLDAMWFRDRMCTFPGCEAKLFVEAHHIRHWADGGATTLENLTLLCDRHHRMLHKGGWTIRGRPPDGLEFIDRWGRVRTRAGPVLARAG